MQGDVRTGSESFVVSTTTSTSAFVAPRAASPLLCRVFCISVDLIGVPGLVGFRSSGCWDGLFGLAAGSPDGLYNVQDQEGAGEGKMKGIEDENRDDSRSVASIVLTSYPTLNLQLDTLIKIVTLIKQ
jgi:hypothetical protein